MKEKTEGVLGANLKNLLKAGSPRETGFEERKKIIKEELEETSPEEILADLRKARKTIEQVKNKKDVDKEIESKAEVENARNEYFAWRNDKTKGASSDLTGKQYEEILWEAEEAYRKIKNETVKELINKGEKEKAQEFLFAEVELKRKNDLENKLVGRGERLKAGISKGIEKWDNFGNEKEKGWKGATKRMVKMSLSLGLIGISSSLSVEGLAKIGIGSASALSGGTLSYLGRKLGYGVAFGTAMGAIPDKYKKWVGAAMIAGSVGFALSGGVVAGAGVVAASAFGYGLSSLTKRYDKKIKGRIEEAKSKIDLNTIETNSKKYEEEIEKIIKENENARIWGKLREAGVALAGSTVFLEVSGITRDIHQTKVDAEHKAEALKAQHNEEVKAQHDAELKHEEELKNAFKGNKVEFSSRGAIQTIENLKAQIHQDYPDISKAPHGVQEFLKTDSAKEAIKLGFFDPNGAESAMIIKGSTLEFDQHGNLAFHDIKTGENHILIDEQNNIEKYHGKMFDSDHSAEIKAEQPPVEIKGKIEFGNQKEAEQPPVEIKGKIEFGNQDGLRSEHLEAPSEFANNPFHLSGEMLRQVTQTYQENISHIFPADKIEIWQTVRGESAEATIAIKYAEAEQESFSYLISFLHRLQDITGLDPAGETPIRPAETNAEYIERALQKAAEMGQLDKVKLKL